MNKYRLIAVLSWTLLLFVTAFAEGSSSYSESYLDRTNFVFWGHYKPVPKAVVEKFKVFYEDRSVASFKLLFEEVKKHPKSMGAVKMLYDAAVRCKQVQEVLQYYYGVAYNARTNNKPIWYDRLAFTYLLRICSRHEVNIDSMPPFVDQMVYELVPLIPEEEYEARFVLTDIAAAFDWGKYRQMLKDLIAIKPKDPIPYTILAIAYRYGFGPIYRPQKNGKPIKIGEGAELDMTASMKYAKKAIAVAPDFAAAYFVAALACSSKEEKQAYLKQYLAKETDKTRESYELAQKALKE